MNKEDIRFYLQTTTPKLYGTLSDTERVNTDYLVNEIKTRSKAFSQEVFNTINELRYHNISNSSDTVIWRLRKAFYHKAPENSTNTWNLVLDKEDFVVISTPTNPSQQSVIVISEGITFTKEHAIQILALGIRTGIVMNDKGELVDGNVNLKECAFGATAKPSGVKNTDVEKLMILGLMSVFIYLAVSLKKR